MANNGGSSSEPAIGIDLGTTNSCVAVWKDDKVTIIANDHRRTTPSLVAFADGKLLIGEDARNLSVNHHANIIYDAKRLIGRRFTDETVQNDNKSWPFKVINSEDMDNKPMFEVTYKDQKKKFAAEEISSMVLLKMKEIAEAHLGKKVRNVVVTVPAYFNDAQRQATKDAGTIAGLNVMSIINEPTATAIAFGLEKMNTSQNVAKNVLIFDLGGGTFDVSLVKIHGRKFEVKAVKGDTHLGGSDFDDRMVEHFVAEAKLKHNKDISGDHKALKKLRIACEKEKRTLSTTKKAEIEIDCLIGNIDFKSSIEIEKFEWLNRDLFAKCMKNVKKCLRQANVEKYEIDEVVLVGGSTRIPKLRKMLTEFFNGKKLCTRVNADEIVAHGAAIYAAKLGGTYTKDDYKVVDVTPFSIGYKSYSSHHMEIVIPKNTIIPMKKKLIVLETHGDGDHKAVTLNVFEGEKVDTRDNYLLGSFKLPTKLKSSFKYIGFTIDQNGILTVSSQLLNISNDKSTVILNHSDRLSRNEIDRMFTMVNKYNTEDQQRKKYMEDMDALKKNFNNMWEKLSCCKKMFGDIDRNIEDVFKDITQYMKENSVLAEISKFENKLKELQNI